VFVKIVVFQVVITFRLVGGYEISDEHAASIFRVEALQCDKSISLYTSTVKIEEACSFDTFVSTYKRARCHKPKDYKSESSIFIQGKVGVVSIF
jgi:hypothetical protein